MDAKLRIADWKRLFPRLSPDEIRMVFEGGKVVSFWDMIVILADFLRAEFYGYTFRLEPSQILDETAKTTIRAGLDAAKSFCDTMQLPIAAGRIPIFQKNGLADESCTGKMVQDEFSDLMDAIEKELAERKLVFIPPPLTGFLEQEALFGEKVFTNFPSARLEIKDAGNCIAGGLHTSAVFHLMRTVEIGLRAVAAKLRVKKLDKKTPVDFGTWQQIIEVLENKTKARFPKTENGRLEKEFFQGLFLEIRALKDVWRNNVMHTRERYDEFAARSVFFHVHTFMLRLAERVEE